MSLEQIIAITLLWQYCAHNVMVWLWGLHFYNANFNEQSLACEKQNKIWSLSGPASFVHVPWNVMSIRNFIETKEFKLAQWTACIMIVKSSMLSYKFYTLWILDQNLARLYQIWQLRQVQGACFRVNKCDNWNAWCIESHLAHPIVQ